MSDMTYICPADAAMKAHREGRITADEARDMVATPSTRTTCARCSWPLKVEGLSDEDADRLVAWHRELCPDYDAYVKALESTKIRTPAGDITVRADPTLKPGEWRLETPWLKAAEWLATPVVYPEHRKSNAAGTLPCGVWSANGDHVPLTLEPLRRPDGFTQSDVDAAKAVLLSKVERKR